MVKKRLSSGASGPKTLFEVLGNGRVVIEYHRGITCYTPEEIWVRTTFGQLQIQGKELSLCCMRREQLCIMGEIDALVLKGREMNGFVE